MVRSGLSLLIPAIHRLNPAYHRIVMFRADLLAGHDRFVAFAASPFRKVRLHTTVYTPLPISAASLKPALQAQYKALGRLPPALRANPLRLKPLIPFRTALIPHPPCVLVQCSIRLLLAGSALFKALCAFRLMRFRIFSPAIRADVMILEPVICFFVWHSPSPRRINSRAYGRAIPLDLLRRESPTPIRVTKNLDKLLHPCCLCHSALSRCCAFLSTRPQLIP